MTAFIIAQKTIIDTLIANIITWAIQNLVSQNDLFSESVDSTESQEFSDESDTSSESDINRSR